MRNALRAILFAVLLFAPSAALAQCYSTVPLPPNTVLGRLGTSSGPCQAIPFAQLSAQLTGASITLNSGNGQTAPGVMSGGNTYSFGATTDKVQMTGLGLGGAAPATGLEVYNAAVSPTGTGQGMFGGSSLNGGVLAGQGSVFDAALQNKAGSIALGVTTNTQNVVLNGTLTAASLSTAGTIAGSICATSAGLILYEAGVNCYAVSGISVASGKTLTIDNTLEFAGTDGTKFTFPSASDTVATLGANQTVTGNKTFSGTVNITGTGQLNGTAFGTFATANAATPPAIGGTTPAAGAFSTLSATTPIGLSSGGTNASTAPGARASTGLNIDELTAHGDSNYSILSTDRTVATSSALTAARTWTLPAASSLNPGQHLYVQDFKGFVSNTNTLTIARSGSDTINGGTASQVINSANGGFLFISDGVSNWSAQALGAQATAGVASLNGQTGSVSVVAGSGISVSTSGGNVTVANTGSLNSTSSVTGATTTYTSAQNTVLIQRSNAGSPMSDLLPGTSPGVLPANTVISVTNTDTAGILSIKAGSGATIKTSLASTGYLYVCPGQSIVFYSDGSNYYPVSLPGRCRLQGSTTIYVSASGSSTNDGLTASTALPDPGTAYSFAQSVLDVNYKTLTFSVATGTYPCVLLNGPLLGANANPTNGSNVTFLGNAGTPANVVISTTSCNNAWLLENGAVATINGFTLKNTFGHDFQADEASIALIENLLFNGQAAGSNLIIAASGAVVYLIGNMTFTVGSFNYGCAWIASNGGSIQTFNTGSTITWTTTAGVNNNTAFACTQYYALIVINTPITFGGAGTVTGSHYSAGNGSTINTAGGGANFFPGNAAGTTGSFGTYQHHNDNDRNALGEVRQAA